CIQARVQHAEELRLQPANADLIAEPARIDAGLGRKEDALNEGSRALQLAPTVKAESTEPYVKMSFAIISTWTGERELALGQFEALTKTPGSHTYGSLRLSPFWDPLRGDPRFEKIVASLAPKEAARSK